MILLKLSQHPGSDETYRQQPVSCMHFSQLWVFVPILLDDDLHYLTLYCDFTEEKFTLAVFRQSHFDHLQSKTLERDRDGPVNWPHVSRVMSKY